jgi:pimeloyl-ACP methyl ester carboxylesterase
MKSEPFQFKDYELACLRWGPEQFKHTILFLHGWMDNAYSFYHYFDEHFDSQCLALEHIGHCQSSSVPSLQSSIQLTDWITPIVDLICYQLKGDISIVAHSFSGGMATLIAGLLPDRIKKMVLFDPVIWAADEQTDLLGSYKNLLAIRNKSGDMPRTRGFETQEQAIKARVNNGITPEPVTRILALRGLVKESDGLWYWKHDPRVRFSKLFLPHQSHIERVWDATQAKVFLFPSADPNYGLNGLIKNYAKKSFCQSQSCETSHYVHFEALESVKKVMRSFFKNG